MNNTRVQELTLSAVMIALSTVLSLVTIFHMPLGGSVTLFSMLPVCLLSIMFGCRWGLLYQPYYCRILSLADVSQRRNL